MDGDEELRVEFACPYCLEEFDVSTLCSHLEDEHCFESKVAVSEPSIHFLDDDDDDDLLFIIYYLLFIWVGFVVCTY